MPTCLDNVNDSLVGTKAGSKLPDRMDADYQWPSSQHVETRNRLGDMPTCLDNVNDSLVGTKAGSKLPDRMDADYQWPSSQHVETRPRSDRLLRGLRGREYLGESA